MKERRYDIDWLRVLVMLAVFFFHCARFFGGGDWHLNNATESMTAWVFIGWLDLWFMPLFFLLSGAGSWYALRSRSNGRYLLERFKRLLFPLYTVGLFLLLPIPFYFRLLSHTVFNGTFWEALPHYFSNWKFFSFGKPSAILPVPFHGHLWFLQFLFLISLVTLPLLRYLRSERGNHFIDTLAGWCRRWGGIFLFLIPVILVRIGLRSFFSGMFTWADFIEYTVYFVIGYLLPSDNRFTESINKHGWICLLLGLLGFVGYGFMFSSGFYDEPFAYVFVLYEIVTSISRWSWIVFVLSLGAKYLKFNNKLLTYSNEAVLPFYILHEPLIVWVGWFVIRRNIGILPKYLIIIATSFTLIMLLYELLVRRFNVVRFFFGMRPKKKPSATPAPRSEGTAA